VVDVRGPDEFVGPLGHIPGALNIGLDDIPNWIRQTETAKGLPIVAVCQTDKRSARAAQLLRGAGYSEVFVLRNGMEGWHRAGFAVESAHVGG